MTVRLHLYIDPHCNYSKESRFTKIWIDLTSLVSMIKWEGTSKAHSTIATRGLNQYKDAILQYRKSHCGDKTILRPSYLHNGIPYTGKTTSLYWIGAQRDMLIWTLFINWIFPETWNIFTCLHKDCLYRYMDSTLYRKDIGNGNSYIGKTASLNWNCSMSMLNGKKLIDPSGADTRASSQYKDRLSQVWGFPC